MDQSLTAQAVLLYQEASLAADELRKKQNAGESAAVPADFAKNFFAFISTLNLGLMDDADNFYGYFLFQMKKEIRFSLADAAGTAFKGTQYVLYINPLIFLPLSPEQMTSSIKHQILHIVSLHLVRAKELRRHYSKLAVNLAMDIVVNTYLDHLPPFSTTLAWVNLNYDLTMTPFETFEYYADHIQTALDMRTDKNDKPDEGSLDGSVAAAFDPLQTHASWDESDDMDEQTLRKFTAHYIDAAHKGQLSNYLESVISSLTDSAGDLPWHWYLKRLVGSIAGGMKKTTARRSRRQPERLDLPGRLRDHTARICVSLDISGSISDGEFKQAVQEVLHMVRSCRHEIILVECDDEIRRTYAVRSLEDVKNRLDVRGGTAFSPVFAYANEHHVNLLVYFTDGKGETKLTVPPRGYRVLWVLSGRSESLSLQEPHGLVKKLKAIKEYDPSLDFDNVEKGGFSMNNQEGMAL